VIDCEVASYGDPAFDLAFVISHILLKALHHAPHDIGLRQLIDTCSSSYLQARRLTHHECRSLQTRVAMLIGLLLLARVDGKSPVEYLDEPKREVLRLFVIPALQSDRWLDPNELYDEWFRHLEAKFKVS
jgi:hypothetical protein